MKATRHSSEPGMLLDIASYARRGPGQRDRLSPDEIQLIARTVHRVPEVMVKVLSRGGQDMKAVGRHFSYLSRKGELEIETDDGRSIEGKGAEAELLEDWDLDIQEQRPTSSLGPGVTRKPPKLVHKLLFSMPPGTPPKKVLEAVKGFAREEFGAKHRYAMVLHTDEPHPHVHMVVKAVSEDGMRMNIRRSDLAQWRTKFAAELRSAGIPANATSAAMRGLGRMNSPDGLYRAAARAASILLQDAVDNALSHSRILPDARPKGSAAKAHNEFVSAWRAMAGTLAKQDEAALADEIERWLAVKKPTRSIDAQGYTTGLVR